MDETNPYFQEYWDQREQLAQFLGQNLHYYEGFAMWLEGYLAHSTGHGALFERKMEEVVHPAYKELFEQFKSFGEQYGGFALMSRLGFLGPDESPELHPKLLPYVDVKDLLRAYETIQRMRQPS